MAQDILGQTVDVGDRVVVAFVHTHSAELRIGRVIGFSETKTDYNPRPQMEIQWELTPDNKTKWGAPTQKKSTKIFVELGRFLKITDDMVTPDQTEYGIYHATWYRTDGETKWGKPYQSTHVVESLEVARSTFAESYVSNIGETHREPGMLYGKLEPGFTRKEDAYVVKREVVAGLPGEWEKVE